MKINLLQAIVDKIESISGLENSVYLYSPELDLTSKTKPFVVVRSLTDVSKIVTFEQAKETEFYIWIYVYPRANEYEAIYLPEEIETILFDELTITVSDIPEPEEPEEEPIPEEPGEEPIEPEGVPETYTSMPLDITVNRLNGTEDDLERYGSVITCIYRIYS